MGYYLRAQGIEDATERRVRALYEQLGLKGASQSFKTTREPRGKFKKYPYLLKYKAISYVNQVWATDITNIKLDGQMVFPRAIVDL